MNWTGNILSNAGIETRSGPIRATLMRYAGCECRRMGRRAWILAIYDDEVIHLHDPIPLTELVLVRETPTSARQEAERIIEWAIAGEGLVELVDALEPERRWIPVAERLPDHGPVFVRSATGWDVSSYSAETGWDNAPPPPPQRRRSANGILHPPLGSRRTSAGLRA